MSLPPSLPAPRACLPACLPPGLPCLCHRQPCLGGVWGDRVGGVSCHGGWGIAGRPGDTHSASGYPLFGVVQPPPFSEWGYVPRVFSAPVLPRKSWGCHPCTFHYSASRIPPRPFMTRHPHQPYSPAPPSSAASVAEHIPSYAGSRLIGLRAVCNNVSLLCLMVQL